MNTAIYNLLEIYEKKLQENPELKDLNIIQNELNKLNAKNFHNHKLYFLLGNIMWQKLQIDDAIYNYKKSLEIKPNYIKAKEQLYKVKKEKMSLITFLMYNNPSTKAVNSIIDSHQQLQKIKYEINLEKKINDQFIIDLYKKIQNVLISKKIDQELEVSQIHRDGVIKYNQCKRHFEVFDTFKIIPENCFTCYKIQILPENVFDLIKLYILFDNINFKKNLTRKCMIELRPNIEGAYKAFIYCVGLQEAEETIKFISPILDKTISKDIPRLIKRGCSEFAQEFPNYKEIDPKNNKFMYYNQNWKHKENIIDEKISKRKKEEYFKANTLKGITLKDAIVINNWIFYAKQKGDLSYKKINQNPKYSNYINDKIK